MRLFSWLRAARSALTPAPERKRPAPCRLMLEVLEARDCPSGGLLDPTFGSGGIVNLPHTTDLEARADAVQPDGKVVIAGYSTAANGNHVTTVQRLNPDGTLDTTFNGTGSVTIPGSDYPTAVALQPDGKILIGGDALVKQGKTYSSEPLVARLNTNGTLDTTFGSKGVWVSASAGGPVRDLSVLTDPAHPSTVTGVVAAVQGYTNGSPCFEAIKLTPAGQLDKTFGSGGVATLTNVNDQLTSMAVDPLNGEVYLAGYNDPPNATNTGVLAALTPAGALDTTFGDGAGYVLADSTYFYDVAVQTVSVNGQPASRLIVAGESSGGLGIVAAYTPGGALNTTFGSGGSFTLPGVAGGTGAGFDSLAVEADGSIVVGGGQYPSGSSYGEMLVGHLTASGVADTSFGPDGTGFTAVQDGHQSSVQGVAIDPTNGDILACGDGTDNNGQHAVIVRLTAP